MRLCLAHHEGEVLAAATMLTVGRHVWYSYDASTSRKREVQPNNAIQWRMMSDAHRLGAAVHDFRGITDTPEESNHLLGLLRFKVGTGGEAVEYLDEWDYPLNTMLHKALGFYMSRADPLSVPPCRPLFGRRPRSSPLRRRCPVQFCGVDRYQPYGKLGSMVSLHVLTAGDWPLWWEIFQATTALACFLHVPHPAARLSAQDRGGNWQLPENPALTGAV
ncbi:hypothetical protein BJY27_008415 [Streptomyces rapamycinicus]|uniref:Peptidoglycan bridge formation protein FemAB n=2 Tax=Streptomyces rapamycinicus TaxID=1226757 RepID=A0A3L8QWL7_STRRN|nr:hypothetical protein [Streptomyces rapamycinicus]RLV71714.1 peptidoglycan bridge formation protein FemAB [Streptomyces rapamycinicus NRRL 5491]